MGYGPALDYVLCQWITNLSRAPTLSNEMIGSLCWRHDFLESNSWAYGQQLVEHKGGEP